MNWYSDLYSQKEGRDIVSNTKLVSYINQSIAAAAEILHQLEANDNSNTIDDIYTRAISRLVDLGKWVSEIFERPNGPSPEEYSKLYDEMNDISLIIDHDYFLPARDIDELLICILRESDKG